MKKNDLITLSDGEKAVIVVGEENSNFSNIYIVKLNNRELRVVDRKTLIPAPVTNFLDITFIDVLFIL
jgi:hypothetical protein